MSDVRKARELESLRRLKLSEALAQDERAQVAKIKASASNNGVLFSGGTVRAITEVRVERVRRTIDDRISIRKDLAGSFPELGSRQQLDELFQETERMIQTSFQALDDQVDQIARAAGAEPAVRQIENENVTQLTAYARREVEMLKREVQLGIHKEASGNLGVSVTSTGSGATLVNIGTIYGGVQQAIGSLNQPSQANLASVLERLAKAIEETSDLGDSRGEYLEQVKFIAEQAAGPAENRQVSVVKGVLNSMRAALQDAANVAQILSLAGPLTAAYFGFKWPH